MGLFDFLHKSSEPTDLPVPQNYNFEKEENDEYYSKNKRKFNSVYRYILFSDAVDTMWIIGYDRSNPYGFNSEVRAKHMFVKECHDLSKSLIDYRNCYEKEFFSSMNRLEELLQNPKYTFKHFNIEWEREEYYRRKQQIIIDFINRSYQNNFENCLDLKTTKGRINRMENWFLKMNYYKMYMGEREQYIIENLHIQWLTDKKMLETN